MSVVLLAASGFGEAIGAGLAAGFHLLLLLSVGLAGGLAIVFLAGLREVPRTTVLAYGLGMVGGLLGGAVGVPPLAVVGAAAGAVAGWRMEDLPFAVFRSRPYTVLLAGSGIGGVVLGWALVLRFLDAFRDVSAADPWLTAVVLGILALPAVAGVGVLVLLGRERLRSR